MAPKLNPDGQVARCIQVLGEYDYEVVHQSGRCHGKCGRIVKEAVPLVSSHRTCRELGN